MRFAQPEEDAALRQLEAVTDCRTFDGSTVLHTTRTPQTLVALVKYLEARGNELQSLEIHSPSLEDVFVSVLSGEKT